MKHDPLFIETIKLQDGRLHNLGYHDARANIARREVLGIETPLNLTGHITIPGDLDRGMYKCRVVYGTHVDEIQITRYRRKKIKTLKIVEGGDIDYRYKYADRSSIDLLFAQRAGCDDILLVRKGYLTDTSYANVAFYDGQHWYTPDTPLLAGTKRQQLLMDEKISEASIKISDLSQFSQVMVFNALIDFDTKRSIPISSIVL